MIIESHYIFLPKEKAKKRTTAREDETIVLNLHRSVGEYISKTFTLSSTVYDKSIFKRAYDTTINVSDITFKCKVTPVSNGKHLFSMYISSMLNDNILEIKRIILEEV